MARFVSINGEWVPIEQVGQQPRDHGNVLWNDRAYQDMNDPRFNSRSTHREYMRANNLTTMDDFKGVWAGAQREREAIMKGSDPQRKHDIARALHQIREQRRR